MSINAPQIKNITTASTPRRFVRGMAGNSLAPVILLECFVTGGRTIQAQKRGGFIEARERFTEEAIGAAFWFAGVKFFNRMNDKIGQKIFSLKDMNFDVGEDNVRKPINTYIHEANIYIKKQAQKLGKKIPEITPDIIAKFKLAKVVSSILLANVLVGLVVPKINQGITKSLYNKQHEHDNDTPDMQVNIQNTSAPFSMEAFLNKGKKEPTFKGMEKMLRLAHNFENNDIYQLLSTDVGIAGGRAVSARNKDERIEVLFRDVSSIFFYLFSMPLVNKTLNVIIDGKASRLDPVASKQATIHMQNFLNEEKNGGEMSVKAFKKAVLGDNTNTGFINKSLLEKLEKNNTITLEEFITYLKTNKNIPADKLEEYIKLAEGMSKLQPERIVNIDTLRPVKDAKVPELKLAIKKSGLKIPILTHEQVKNVFRGGIINNPEFLKDVFFVATQDEVPFVKTKDGKAMNPYKFIDNSRLDALRKDLYDYAKNIIDKAEKAGKDKITMKTIKNACAENFIKNSLTWGAGFAVSAIFLSSIIPKMQYWITKKRTGEDGFPGIAEFTHPKDNNIVKK